ncbi:MAG: IS630 family transposase [Dehalococcoidia bacterium]
MPFQSTRAPLVLSTEDKKQLVTISRSRIASRQAIERAQILLAYAQGVKVSEIARTQRTNRPKVERAIDKALQLGAVPSLKDLSGRGRKPEKTKEALAWVVSLACQKPKDLGYAGELWTTSLLAQHVRGHCLEAGHPSLQKLARGTVSKILASHELRPHKVRYYLERRDPEFDIKMAQVLCVYRQVELLRNSEGETDIAILSYDEKPGIQAIGTTGPDLPPVPSVHPTFTREFEYVRHGTLSLLAGIDLSTGHVHGLVAERHRSREFIDFLRMVDDYYPATTRIRVILDNHSAHVSKETRTFLATRPNRFEFIFTPKHGSWLNLIETFFSKLARSVLRGIRVESKQELKDRIELALRELNQTPVVFRWKYKLDELFVAGQ